MLILLKIFFYTSGRISHTFDATYHALADVY